MALASSVNDVKTKRRLYDCARVPDVERERRVLEALHHLSATEATEVTP